MTAGWQGPQPRVVFDGVREPVKCCPDPADEPPETIAQEAHRLVHGPRRNSYGHPADDYARTVGAFNALTGRDLTIGDGILFMQLVKLSRQRHTPKRDNLVDLAGYALCEQMTVDADRWTEVP